MGLAPYLLLSSALFALGVFGLLTRRNAVGVLASVELMANAANINLVAFARFRGAATGQIFALFATALTVTEVALGLALVILLYRARADVSIDNAKELRG
jgi:NADH-quinone oxidoreductase subunit K